MPQHPHGQAHNYTTLQSLLPLRLAVSPIIFLLPGRVYTVSDEASSNGSPSCTSRFSSFTTRDCPGFLSRFIFVGGP